MDAIVKVLESAGAIPEPSGETGYPTLWHILYLNATTQRINGSINLVGQEKI